MKKLFVLVCFLLMISPAFAVLEKDSIKVFAVTNSGQALSADLILEIEPGNGQVWSSVRTLVGTTTQKTEKIAVEVAKNYSSDVESYDFKFDINSTASLVEGPSAGAAMGLLVISMLQDKKVPDYVAVTGTLNEDGSVGKVGGVFEKSKEAAKTGIKLFMIPEGEAKQTVKFPDGVKSINLLEYALAEWNMKIVEVENIDDVLNYAFMDPEEIDINKISKPIVPDFVPKNIAYAEHLEIMHDIAKRYVEKAELELTDAKNSLSNTMIEDADLLNFLLSTLNSSGDSLDKAKILVDQNYLYSGANYAFISKVSASMVKDIAENPSLLQLDSTLFDLKLKNLKEEVSSLEEKLDEFIPIDFLEWHIAAKQRLLYAKNNIAKISTDVPIIINIGNGSEIETSINRLQDYEYALAWAEVAEDFFEKTKASKKKVKPDLNFKSKVEELMVEVENKFSVLEGNNYDDIQRRIDAANLAFKREWFLSSYFDAATALALIEAELEIQEKSLPELTELLEEKISMIESQISKSTQKPVWAQLFLDHSKYFFEGIKFYKEQRQTSKAIEMAKSGVSLIFMTERLLNASHEMNSYYSTFGPEDFIVTPFEKSTVFGELDLEKQYTLLVLTLVIISLVFIILLVKVLHNYSLSKYPVQFHIQNIKKLQKKLDKDLANKKISKKQFDELSSVYSAHLSELLKEDEKRSEHMIKIDELDAQLFSYERMLRKLKSHYKAGLITKDDFEDTLVLNQKKIDFLKKQISAERKWLSKERKKLQEKSIPLVKKSVKKPKVLATKKSVKTKKAAGKKSFQT